MSSPFTSSAAQSLGGAGSETTLVEGSSFCISSSGGDIIPGMVHGLFFRDTRFLSEYVLRLNGKVPEALGANRQEPFRGEFVVRDHPSPGQADSNIVVYRDRFVGRGMREDIRVWNYGTEPALCSLELTFDSDFADLFEVKGGRVEKVGETEIDSSGDDISFKYHRSLFKRETLVTFSVRPKLQGRSAFYEAIIQPQSHWGVCVEVRPGVGEGLIPPTYQCGQPVEKTKPVERLEEWRLNFPKIKTECTSLFNALEQSGEDLASLRIFDPDNPKRVHVAAGAPWFMALFGRDSCLVSWMSMIVDPQLALGSLNALADLQGKEVNPISEEEPGRILHEVRFGESAIHSGGGEMVYYGSVDSTPLFVMTVGELARWGVAEASMAELMPKVDAAIEWIDNYGDRDGDGFVEYQRTTDSGIRNQAWKDSLDSVHFLDGQIADTPIAICEVQGYVYSAYHARMHMAVEQGDLALAKKLSDKADALKKRFNEDFWMDELGYFAMGLDKDKRQIDIMTSNMGHLLWTGIVDEEKAPFVRDKLMSDHMFTGYGIRTLGNTSARYNPFSYHNGSIWPHDNAICAAGLMRYGFTDAAQLVTRGMLDTSEHFGASFPELFGGLPRAEMRFPVRYPASCKPQAWAAASPLLYLRTLLRLDPDLRNSVLHVAPVLPDWIGTLRIDGIRMMGGELSIEAEGTSLRVIDIPEGLTLVKKPRPATAPELPT